MYCKTSIHVLMCHLSSLSFALFWFNSKFFCLHFPFFLEGMMVIFNWLWNCSTFAYRWWCIKKHHEFKLIRKKAPEIFFLFPLLIPCASLCNPSFTIMCMSNVYCCLGNIRVRVFIMAADNEKNMKKKSRKLTLVFFSPFPTIILSLLFCVLKSDGCSDWVENRIPHVGSSFKKTVWVKKRKMGSLLHKSRHCGWERKVHVSNSSSFFIFSKNHSWKVYFLFYIFRLVNTGENDLAFGFVYHSWRMDSWGIPTRSPTVTMPSFTNALTWGVSYYVAFNVRQEEGRWALMNPSSLFTAQGSRAISPEQKLFFRYKYSRLVSSPLPPLVISLAPPGVIRNKDQRRRQHSLLSSWGVFKDD
jgi:hypothetical protein